MQDAKNRQKVAICAPSYKGTYRQSEKNLLSSDISSRCPHNMVNFGPLAAEIHLVVSGNPANFDGFRALAALLHGTWVVGVSQTAALNRGRNLCSAAQPSLWALAHNLVMVALWNRTDHYIFILSFVMVALCNRADHYIFALWFLSSSSFFFFSSPNLSGRRLDVYHASIYGVALVRI